MLHKAMLFKRRFFKRRFPKSGLRQLCRALPILLWLPASYCLAAERSELPSLGDSSSGIISLEQERVLGQQLLRSVRAQTSTLNDPLLQDYLEHLIYRLASHSQLEDRRIDLVVINAPQLNAFAAPGGIVGVNHGLFHHAETAHEISAILAHEIAHLSQRHFARQITAGRKSSIISLAGLLAGAVLAATTGGGAGLAALTSTQAIGQHQALRYSREREAEADRIGIHTLAEADMDPRAMAHMFERLQKSSRYSAGDQIPEFLRTHPVTRSRISDAYNQTIRYPKETWPLQLDYQLMRTRARAIASNEADLAQHFETRLTKGDEIEQVAALYGLILVKTRELDVESAQKQVKQLRADYPLNIPFRIAEAGLFKAAEQHEDAIDVLEQTLSLNPNNYPASIALAETYIAVGQPHAAADVLMPFSIKRPNDEHVWYLLAEAWGLAKNIPKLHEARAEYFVLNGDFKQALKQLTYALELVEENFQQSTKVKQRMLEILEIMES